MLIRCKSREEGGNTSRKNCVKKRKTKRKVTKVTNSQDSRAHGSTGVVNVQRGGWSGCVCVCKRVK